jgi:hypothetical protein
VQARRIEALRSADEYMTRYARVVLQDCEAAVADLRAGATGHVYRSRWVGAVALLRAVGHVLDKVDSRLDAAMATAIREAYAELKRRRPEPRNFWDFIEAERNNVLKVYQFSAKEHVTVRPGTLHFELSRGVSYCGPSGPTTYDQVIDGGPFYGVAPPDAVARSIAWWLEYLDGIDGRAMEIRQASA